MDCTDTARLRFPALRSKSQFAYTLIFLHTNYYLARYSGALKVPLQFNSGLVDRVTQLCEARTVDMY